MTPNHHDYDGDEDSELRGPVTHIYHQQSGNGNGNGSKLTAILLGCILAIVGFLGIQIWNINERLARVETSVQIIRERPANQ